MNEFEAKVLLLGLDALPVRERWLLAWLVQRPERMSIAFQDVSGLSFAQFNAMCARWTACGLIGSAYAEEWDAFLPRATDRAAELVLMSSVEWAVSTVPGKPIDLDCVVAA
ncbi:hypothetical protein [Nocardia jiangxiensis]|uniref:hypothetical protein n=1 Tax=Nocardia jiangxiensis TaxID=282685 RepID=UPI0002ED0E7C|nr:hypothetical protein [Nocardia jiangxiensis]